MGILDIFKEKKHKRSHSYLIEIRMSGFVKDSIREIKEGISRNFHVTKRKIIPHVTLVGELSTNDGKKLVKDVVDISKKYQCIKFQLDGFDHFRKDVIIVKIKPSEELEQLRTELVKKLSKYCNLSPFDPRTKFDYHATIVLHDIDHKFEKIWDYVQTWKIPKIEQYVVRITILTEKRKILHEYDLMLKKNLDRQQSLDKKTFRKTIDALKKKCKEPMHSDDCLEITNSKQMFLFSDAHFDHRKIIGYCRRPFRTVESMNKELLSNWNHSVRESDSIYFLGDMTYGKRRRPIDYWLGKLNGDVHYIRGNHDTDKIERASVIPTRFCIRYGDYKFLLMHDPYRPHGYDGWIIHGDKHNNSMERYPFINQKTKTVNVCAEMVNYTPQSLDGIISLIETGKSFRTINEPISRS